MRKLLKLLMIGASLTVAGAASAQSVNVQVDVDDNSRRVQRHFAQDFDGDRRVQRRFQRDLTDDDGRAIRRVERRYDRDDDDGRVIRRVERRFDMDVARPVPVVSRRVIERRVVVPARTRTVCRMVMRERVRPSGVIVRRPVEVCREVVAGRRVFVD